MKLTKADLSSSISGAEVSKTVRHWCRNVLGPKCLRSPKCQYTR